MYRFQSESYFTVSLSIVHILVDENTNMPLGSYIIMGPNASIDFVINQFVKQFPIVDKIESLGDDGVDLSKSEGVRVIQVVIKLEANRNSLLFSAPKMGYLVIFGFFLFSAKMNFHFCFIFRFRS